jgi:DNA-binding PadR family transcriptional regulator
MADGDRHGYGIIREVDERTDGVIKLRTGTLYTLLQRLLDEELVEPRRAPAAADSSAPGPAAGHGDPRRKYYGLTELGRGVLQAEATRLQSLVSEARRKQVLGRASKV